MSPSITEWWRLESHARDPELTDSVELRLADPLWLLGRQWQTGEFHGVDGGTPVNARARLRVRHIGWYRPGGLDSTATPVALDTAAAPLDETVESETAPPDLRLALAGGRQWLRELGGGAATLAVWLADNFGIAAAAAGGGAAGGAGSAPDLDAERLSAAAAGRALDGAAVYAALVAAIDGGDFTALPGDPAATAAAAPGYVAWWEARAGGSPASAPAWVDGRMEYAFTLATATGDEKVLAARQYRGGGLDWAAFDHAPGAALRPSAGAPADDVLAVALPTPVTFKGMPGPRFWQFEDPGIAFPAIDAAADDLARLVAVEFALIYGNNFFVVPIRLPVGTLSEVRSLVVEDSFGLATLVGFDGGIRRPRLGMAPVQAVDRRPWRIGRAAFCAPAPADDRGGAGRNPARGRPAGARRRRGDGMGHRADGAGRRRPPARSCRCCSRARPARWAHGRADAGAHGRAALRAGNGRAGVVVPPAAATDRTPGDRLHPRGGASRREPDATAARTGARRRLAAGDRGGGAPSSRPSRPSRRPPGPMD